MDFSDNEDRGRENYGPVTLSAVQIFAQKRHFGRRKVLDCMLLLDLPISNSALVSWPLPGGFIVTFRFEVTLADWTKAVVFDT